MRLLADYCRVMLIWLIQYKWVPELRNTNPKTPIILVGTQSDLRNDEGKLVGKGKPSLFFKISIQFFPELRKKGEKQIAVQEAEALVSQLKLKTYKECSALTGDGLKDVFDEAVVIGLGCGEEETINNTCCSIL